MKKTTLLCQAACLALGTLAATAAYADTADTSSPWLLPNTNHAYFGINLGRSDTDTPCYAPFSCSNSHLAGKIYTGGNFNQNFGMEIGYVNMGDADRNGGTIKAQGVNLSLVGTVPLGSAFDLFGKVGGTYGWTETTASPLLVGYDTGKRNGLGLSYGAGMGFNVDRQNQVVVEWDRQKFKFKPEDEAVDLYTVGWKHSY